MILTFYTDGSVKDNVHSTKKNCMGGVGIYCKELNLKISNSYDNATNNRMELRAILDCLRYILDNNLQLNNDIVIYSDSQYSVNCCTIWYMNWNSKKNGWDNKKNVELIKDITLLLEQNNNIILKWCKGHSGIAGNEIADKLANMH
jgi:ribonuclease HI